MQRKWFEAVCPPYKIRGKSNGLGEKAAAIFFKKYSFTDCLPDKFWQSGQNCIQLVQMKVFPRFLLKNQIYNKGSLRAKHFRQNCHKDIFYLSRLTFWEAQFFLKEKKFFCVLFRLFAEIFPNFGYISGT